jgi:hypothetical protein
MNITTNLRMHAVLFCLGLILIICGIITRTAGAPVIGLIIAAVNIRQWQRLHIKQSMADNS